jgi:phenylacetate-CoA ligase
VSFKLDALRSTYFKLPPSLKALYRPLLMAIPVSARYGKTYRMIREQVARSETDAEFVRQYQRSSLGRLLQLASSRSTFYSQSIRASFGTNFGPANLNLSDLQSMPILTKAEVNQDPQAFCIGTAGEYDIDFTSGTSGHRPTKLFLERGRRVHEIAFIHHIWSRIGYRLGDGRAVLRDYGGNYPSPGKTWRYDAPLRELWLSPFHLNESTMDQHLALLHRHRVKYLWGLPSTISTLARHALTRSWKKPSGLRGVITASEALFPHQRQIIHDGFKVPVSTYFGLSERIAIAGEVPGAPDIFEFEPLYGIAELVDDFGRPISKIGERGRLIATGLVNKAMALIRYDTGDRATMVEPATSENCYRLRASNIRSRWNQDFVVGRNNERISVVDLYHDSGFIADYQYVQSAPGFVTVRVQPHNSATTEDLVHVIAVVRRRVVGALELQMEVVDSIPSGRTGKRKCVIQNITGYISDDY